MVGVSLFKFIRKLANDTTEQELWFKNQANRHYETKYLILIRI